MFVIREAGLPDLDELLPMFLDMERHYHGRDVVDATSARLRLERALRFERNGVVLMAARGSQLVGFATLFQTFPARALQSAWVLKELYVLASARGAGVGRRLMRAAAQVAVARGGARLDFTTEAENEDARRFYERLGAELTPKVCYRFDSEALAKLVTDEHPQEERRDEEDRDAEDPDQAGLDDARLHTQRPRNTAEG